jgi:CubicO group peptidase (beta-lactamase class C family)
MELRLKRIENLMASYVASGKVAGATALIARHDKLVLFSHHGYSNLATKQVMDENTIFRIYSMTKPITSVAMMILYEQGHFQLDTPVSAFIPEFKNLEVFAGGTADDYKTIKPTREMNIADLLAHTSGLTYEFMHASVVDELYRKAGIRGLDFKGTLEDMIKKLAAMPLLFTPGTRWNYSLSTDVLAYLVQIISGCRFDEFVKKHILQPLAMKDTDFYVPPGKQDRFAVSYTHRDLIPELQKLRFAEYIKPCAEVGVEQKLIPIDDPKTGNFSKPPIYYSGGGGLVSTPVDYLNFARMLLNKGSFEKEQILSRKTVELMTVNRLPADLADFAEPGFSETPLAGIGFGLGFAVTLDPVRANILGTADEYTWGGAANTMFFIDPQEEFIAMQFAQLMPVAYNIRKEFRVAVYQALT